MEPHDKTELIPVVRNTMSATKLKASLIGLGVLSLAVFAGFSMTSTGEVSDAQANSSRSSVTPSVNLMPAEFGNRPQCDASCNVDSEVRFPDFEIIRHVPFLESVERVAVFEVPARQVFSLLQASSQITPYVKPPVTPQAAIASSPEPTVTSTPTAEPTASPEPTPTQEPTATPEPTPDPEPAVTPSPEPTQEPEPSPAPTTPGEETPAPTTSPEPSPSSDPLITIPLPVLGG